HGYWLGAGGLKMSKTLGNVVDPVEIVELFGADALRYFLARNMRSDADSQISVELIRQAYNSELGNKIGNLFSRAGKFAKSRFDNRIPKRGALAEDDERTREIAFKAAASFARPFEMHEIPQLSQAVVVAFDTLNSYFAEQAPWELVKKPETIERCATVIYVTLDSLRVLFEGLRQIIPTSADQALAALGCLPVAPDGQAWEPKLDRLEPGRELPEIEVLYPRITEN